MKPLTHVRFEVADEIARITLDRPEARNALSPQMREDLDECIAAIREDAGERIRAVVITGAGRAFCAGGDVKAMNDPARRDPARRRAAMRAAHERLHALLHLEVPVIAAVNGHAAGAGFALALLADFIVAAPSSRFANSFGRIGLVPDWACLFTLPRIVGLQRAKELVFTGRRFDGHEAKEMGLVHEVVGRDEELLPAALALAGRFRGASTHAIGLAKAILLQSFESDLRAMLEAEAFGQGISYSSPYHEEAVRRFAEKSPPRFDWGRAE